jgi:hypothetical protein
MLYSADVICGDVDHDKLVVQRSQLLPSLLGVLKFWLLDLRGELISQVVG